MGPLLIALPPSFFSPHRISAGCGGDDPFWPGGALFLGGSVVGVAVLIWFVLTVLEWATAGGKYKPTLVEVLRRQAQFVSQLCRRIR